MSLKFNVNHQIIKQSSVTRVVRDSKDYLTADFTFTSEWDGAIKTAVFKAGSEVYNVILTNDSCVVPWEVLTNDYTHFTVGVFANDLITSNESTVFTIKSVVSELDETIKAPSSDIYAQIIERLQKLERDGVNIETLTGKIDEYLANKKFVTDEDLANAVNDYIQEHAEDFDGHDGEPGANGASAYEIAVNNGFEGTEAEWLESLKVVGPKGDTPAITASATVDNTTGTPRVTVEKTETTDGTNFEFNFTGLKGPKGASGEGGGSGEADGRIPLSISAVKEKTEYNQNEVISLDDLLVTVTYDDESTETLDNYTTNLAELDTFTAGLKRLVIDFYKNGVKVSTSVNLKVSFTESFDGIQYAYKLANAGAIRNNIVLLGLNYKLFQYTDLRFKFKMKVTIDQNNSTTKTNIMVGNMDIFRSKKLTTLQIPAGAVGDFELVVDAPLDYKGGNKHPENGDVPLLYLYTDANGLISGMFEITDASFALTSEVLERPVSISAVKTNKYFVQGDDVEITDITTTITYNLETTEVVDSTKIDVDTSEVDADAIGDKNIVVSYTKNGISATQTITLHFFSKDKTEPDTFTELTAPEWYNAWNYGINLGNCFDPQGTSMQPDDKGDKWIDEQEIHWNQPKTTQRNIQQIADAGFQMIRIPITWYCNSYMKEDGIRHMGRFHLYRIKEVVDWAIDAGLYVLINTHHDSKYVFDLGLADQILVDEKCELAKQYWTDIANKFKYHNEKLAFEGFNEIDNKKNSWVPSVEAQEQMNQLNQAFVDAVRATGENNTKRVLVCPFLIHRNAKVLADNFVCPNDSSDPDEKVSHYIGTAVHWYPSTWNQSIDAMMSAIEGFMTETGVPIMVNEYGMPYAATENNFSNRLMFYQNYVARAKQHRVKTVIWDNGTDYNVLRKWNSDLAKGKSPLTQEQSDTLVNAIASAYENNTAYALPDSQVLTYNSFDNLVCGNITSAGEETDHLDWTYFYTKDLIPCKPGQQVSIICNQMSERAAIKGLFVGSVVWYNSSGSFMKIDSSNGGYGKKNVLFTITETAYYFRVIFYVAMGPRMTTQEDQQAYLFDNGDSLVVSVSNVGDEHEVTLSDRVPYKINSLKVLDNGVVDATGNVVTKPEYILDISYDEGKSHLEYYSSNRLNLGESDVVLPEISGNGTYELGISYTYNGVTLTKMDTGIEFLIGKLPVSLATTLENNSFNSSEMSKEDIKTAIEANAVNTVTYTDNSTTVVTENLTYDYSDVIFDEIGTCAVTVSYEESGYTVSTTFNIEIVSNVQYYINPTYNTALAIDWLTRVVDQIHTTWASQPEKQLYKFATNLGLIIDSDVAVFNIGDVLYPYNGMMVHCEADDKFYIHLNTSKYFNNIDGVFFMTGYTLASEIPKQVGLSAKSISSSAAKYTDAQGRIWYELSVFDSNAATTQPSELSRGIISVPDFTDIDVLEL